MLNNLNVVVPEAYSRILAKSNALGFAMNSDVLTGALLRTLAASKPGGSLLELGTGCGLGTCWLLDGMTADARLVSVETDEMYQGVANGELGNDPRLALRLMDGAIFLETTDTTFDLIYADAWPGKYTNLDDALRLLNAGGIYLIDDMLPQPNWPPNHSPNVETLLDRLQRLHGFAVTTLAWSTGLVMCVKQ